MKKSYQTPRLTVHGTVAELTQQTKNGTRLDRTFSQNTPVATLLQLLPTSLKTS